VSVLALIQPLQKQNTATIPYKGENIMDSGGLVAIGAGLAVGLAAIGTGIAQARIGAAGMGVIAEKPNLLGLVILLIAIPETMVILGFAVAAMVLLLGG
jgi:V/A-type H+-transporting ATPase subunit K